MATSSRAFFFMSEDMEVGMIGHAYLQWVRSRQGRIRADIVNDISDDIDISTNIERITPNGNGKIIMELVVLAQ